MKKQYNYPNLVTRLIATCLDLLILSMIMQPILFIMQFPIFFIIFQEYLESKGIRFWQISQIKQIMSSPNLMHQNINTSPIEIYYLMSFTTINFLAISLFFFICWSYTATSPGKKLLGLKIVDSTLFTKPTKKQCLLRVIGAWFAIFGIWSVFLNKKHQAFHDKISNTVVIKGNVL